MNKRSDLPLAQPHNRDQKRLLAEALADSHERAIFVDTPTLTRNIFARNPLPDNSIDDPQPDFPPRLIERADALCYSLPMLAPDGSRCHVVLVGSFAAWCALMTALVRAGYTQAEPQAWQEGGAQ